MYALIYVYILLVKVMFLVILPYSFLVGFFKIFREDNVSVLPDSLHTTLKIKPFTVNHIKHTQNGYCAFCNTWSANHAPWGCMPLSGLQRM